jgi:uncharacterized protein (DUF2252 family)
MAGQQKRSAARAAAGREPASRAALGRAARKRLPLDGHAACPRPAGGPDAVTILLAQAESRVPELVPIRHGRMLVSPFTFYRGAAAVMAADLAASPHTGLIGQLCGDAHLSNFGLFASPERRLVFDINDFDETYPGPWEWDVKRLAASLVVAARDNGFRRKVRAAVVLGAVGRYREAMARFAGMGELDVWYTRADIDEVGPILAADLSKARRKQFARAQAKARTHNSMQALRKLTALVDGRRRFIADPPLIVPLTDLLPDVDGDDLGGRLSALLAGSRANLAHDRRHLLDAFEPIDLARKVVGVGSVGTRCWVALLRGRDDDDPLLLQVKEAQPSVLAGHLDGAAPDAGSGPADSAPRAGSPPRNEGERVVCGQRLMQAASDIFLSWQSAEGIDGRSRDFYVRQMRDWKGSAIVEQFDPEAMRTYAALCGWTLARAHARTGDRIAIGAYLGDTATFDQAIVEFAERYADHNERDYAALAHAVREGRAEARTGV